MFVCMAVMLYDPLNASQDKKIIKTALNTL